MKGRVMPPLSRDGHRTPRDVPPRPLDYSEHNDSGVMPTP